METLVLPAQDQLAYHQDSHNRRLSGIMYSAKMLPHSSRKSCGSPSRIGLAFADTKGNFTALNSLPGDCQSSGDGFPPGLLPRPGDFLTSGNTVLGFPNPTFFGSAGCSPSRCVTTPCLPALRAPLANGLLPASQVSNWKMVNASSRSFSAPRRFACRRDGFASTQRACHVADNSMQSVIGGQNRGISPRFINAVSEGSGCKIFLHDYAEAFSSGESLSGRKSVIQVLERHTDTDFANKITGEKAVENRSINGTHITKRLPLHPALDRNANDPEKKKETASISAPVVTILQRPKAKDVAAEKLARFFGEGVVTAQENSSSSSTTCSNSESVYLDCALTGEDQVWASDASHLDGPPNACSEDGAPQPEFSTMRQGSAKSTVKSLNREGYSSLLSSHERTDASSKPRCRSKQMNDSEYIQQIGILTMPSDEDMFGLVNFGQVAARPVLSTQCKCSMGACKAVENDSSMVIGGVCREVSVFCPPAPVNERWAGPAFSNSPPPSSLPFPKFSMRQLRSASFETSSVGEGPSEAAVSPGSMWTPVSPSEKSQLIPSQSSSSEELLGFGLDMAHATKDLRRILNLDFDS